MISVLIADDDSAVQLALKVLFADEPDIDVIGEAPSAQETHQFVTQLQPEVVLLDSHLPGQSIELLIRELRESAAPPAIVVLATDRDIGTVRRMVTAGATGYALRCEEARLIILATRAVAAGGIWIGPIIAEHLKERLIAEQAEQPVRPIASYMFTDRELDVLRLLPQGLTNIRIAEQLNITERTVRSYLRSICDKISVNSRVEAAIWAAKHDLDAPLNAKS